MVMSVLPEAFKNDEMLLNLIVAIFTYCSCWGSAAWGLSLFIITNKYYSRLNHTLFLCVLETKVEIVIYPKSLFIWIYWLYFNIFKPSYVGYLKYFFIYPKALLEDQDSKIRWWLETLFGAMRWVSVRLLCIRLHGIPTFLRCCDRKSLQRKSANALLHDVTMIKIKGLRPTRWIKQHQLNIKSYEFSYLRAPIFSICKRQQLRNLDVRNVCFGLCSEELTKTTIQWCILT